MGRNNDCGERQMTNSPATDTRIVLASASPRRLDLLRQIGITPDIVEPANIDESIRVGELPRDHALRLALEKGRTVAARHPGAWVLAADTVVACGRRILPKTEDEKAARRCLTLLSGRRHVVYGGVAVFDPNGTPRRRVVRTAVRFKRMERLEVEDYLATGEWRGKAGGYAVQGYAAVFVAQINGSYSNVVGLPLFETNALLKGAFSR